MKSKLISNSSQVARISYDEDTNKLIVEYINRKGGENTSYEYHDVPEYVYTEAISAPSAGKYLIANVQRTYGYNKL